MTLEKKYTEVKELLHVSRNIVITTHTNPDGDAIGSSLALYHFLKQKHVVSIVIPDKFPAFLSWMIGSDKIIIHSQQPEHASSLMKKAEIIFCLDFNEASRIKELSEYLVKSKAVKILIDHHLQPEKFYDYAFSQTNTSSTAELIYDFIIALNGEKHIDKIIADSLYVGIMTDTGSFSYSCEYSKTFLVAANLIKYGVNAPRVNNLVYGSFRENRLRLLGYSLCDGLVVLPYYSTAYIKLSGVDLAKFDYQVGDTEGLVNYAISLQGIFFAALFMEMKHNVKISFRSVGNFSVNDFARMHFNGGGHKNAAGGNDNSSLNETINKFVKLLPEYKNKINASVK